MSIKPETRLQQSIQNLIESRGGYVKKNHGNMITKKGIADLTACYKGFYLAIETKEDGNIPTQAQGIHCRRVKKAGGVSIIARSKEDVKILLDAIDEYYDKSLVTIFMDDLINYKYIDDGTRY